MLVTLLSQEVFHKAAVDKLHEVRPLLLSIQSFFFVTLEALVSHDNVLDCLMVCLL